MSRGRKAFRLEDMRAAARDGFAAEVVALVLPDAGPEPVESLPVSDDLTDWCLPAAPGYLQPEPPKADRLLDWDRPWWGLPVDEPYRTFPQDVTDEAADMARTRLPFRLSGLVDAVVYGDKDIRVPYDESKAIRDEVERCRVLVMRSLPKTPPRRKPRKPINHKPRVEGPCSAVVTRTADGRCLVNGYEVDEILPEDRDPFGECALG